MLLKVPDFGRLSWPLWPFLAPLQCSRHLKEKILWHSVACGVAVRSLAVVQCTSMVALAPNTSETSPWDVLDGFPKLHSRARETKPRFCTEAPHSKSFGRVEIWLVIYESCEGLESFTRDPIGFDGGWSHYSFVNGRALIELDPSGLAPGGNGAVLADCRRILYATIAGWRLTGLNCSADLMASWLRKKPDPCPSSCLDALNSNGFGFVNEGCLKSRMAFLSNCPGTTTENFEASGSHYFAPGGKIGAPGGGDDLAFSFGHVNWSASGKCVATCAAKAGSCCCSCSGSCGYDLTLGPDKYDFDKGNTNYPHPLYCAWYVQEYGGLKSFSATCRKTVFAQPISFDRCPGPPLPWSTPCSQTKQTGNTNVIE